MEEVVSREVGKIGGKKGCPLAPFIYHLYARYGILTSKEREQWEEKKELEDREPPSDREEAPAESE